MSDNTNLGKAKIEKNDEFYTRMEDIEDELQYYKVCFKGKTVYCNCDEHSKSNFLYFFKSNFENLGLKRLLVTYKEKMGLSSVLDMYRDGLRICTKIYMLNSDGDFRSNECIELLKQSDIVVTNPPFSLFREFVKQLMDYDKKFLIIGSMNAITYKDFFHLLKYDKVWLGVNRPKIFITPYGQTQQFGNIYWYTNLDHKRRHEPLELTNIYSLEKYPKYDNYNAINVDKILDIPYDYDGEMGVPISFLYRYCPQQFEIVGISGDLAKSIIVEGKKRTGRFYIDGHRLYDRVVIRKRI